FYSSTPAWPISFFYFLFAYTPTTNIYTLSLHDALPIYFDVTAKMDMVSGDASFRRYFRLHCFNHSWIAVDAPADKEDNPRFVAVAKAWRDHEVAVPKVIAHDFERGFMLLEDFGDQLLWPALHADGLSEKD